MTFKTFADGCETDIQLALAEAVNHLGLVADIRKPNAPDGFGCGDAVTAIDVAHATIGAIVDNDVDEGQGLPVLRVSDFSRNGVIL